MKVTVPSVPTLVHSSSDWPPPPPLPPPPGSTTTADPLKLSGQRLWKAKLRPDGAETD